MVRLAKMALWAAVCSLGIAPARAEDNLVVDASFESPLPAWFAERAGTSFCAGKEQVPGAADGRSVLVIEGWDRGGSRILSGPIRLNADADGTSVVSATVAVWSFGKAADASFEWALFDEPGKRPLATFGRVALDRQGAWHTISQTGVRLAGEGETSRLQQGESAAAASRHVGPKGEARTYRLGFVLAGPQADARVEVDSVGLFRGATLGTTADNSDLAVLEAEELADGHVWKVVDHYPSWYRGTPSRMKMLAGPHAIPPEANRPVSRRLPVRHAGPHTLWVRFLAGPYAGKWTVVLRQNEVPVAEREFTENDPQHGGGYQWVWESLRADLHEGEVELVLTRPNVEASWVTRKLDLFVLTNRPDYAPAVGHFRPQGYLRFTHLSSEQEPFCLWIWVRRHEGPQWYANPGMLTRAGLSESYYVPQDKSKWLAANTRSPWVRISDYVLAAGERNNVQITATRQMHTQGFVAGRMQGRLEFAVGPERRIVKSLAIDQAGPRILLTLPYDLDGQADQIKTARDYLQETEAELAKLGPPPGRPAQWLNLAANLGLQAGLDDPEILRREIGVIRNLGFNQTYHALAPPGQSLAFHEQHGLLPRFGGGARPVERPAAWLAAPSEHGTDAAARRGLRRPAPCPA